MYVAVWSLKDDKKDKRRLMLRAPEPFLFWTDFPFRDRKKGLI